MKKLLVILFVSIIAVSAIFAVDFNELDKYSYAGASIAQYTGKDFGKTTILSTQVDLSSANGNKMAYGLTVGAGTIIVDRVHTIVEVDVDFSSLKSFIIDAGVGGTYYLLDDTFHLGFGGKVSYFYLVNLVGTLKNYSYGYDVNGRYFTANAGSPVSYDVMGIAVKPFVTMSFDLNDLFAVGLTAGYKFGFSLYSYVSVDGHNIGKPSGFNPKVNPGGISASVYGIYKF